MARPDRSKPATPKSDLELWEENGLQGSLTHLPALFKLRAADMGLSRSYKELADTFVNAESKDDREDAERIVRTTAWKFLTLMRLDSGLDFTDAMPNTWEHEELIRANWGNDFTPSTNPLNVRGTQNTTSPRPGNFYRNFCLNWEVVIARLHYWEPEAVASMSQEKITKAESDNHRRKQALEAFSKCDALNAAWHKKFKAYTESVRAEYKAAHETDAKDLEDARPKFTQSAA